jgi:hypothetical protein
MTVWRGTSEALGLEIGIVLSLIESFCADASVQLILRHPPSSAEDVAV